MLVTDPRRLEQVVGLVDHRQDQPGAGIGRVGLDLLGQVGRRQQLAGRLESDALGIAQLDGSLAIDTQKGTRFCITLNAPEQLKKEF